MKVCPLVGSGQKPEAGVKINMPLETRVSVETPQQRWRRLHLERSRNNCRVWYYRNLESERERSRRKSKLRRQQHPKKVLEENRRWREENRLKLRLIHRSYHEKNRQKRKEQCKAYQKLKRSTDPQWVERQRKIGRDYYLQNKDKIKARRRARQKDNPSYWVNQKHARRARLLGSSVNSRSVKEYVRRIKSRRFSKCYYCGVRVPTEDIHFDHVLALSKGGAHSIGNICVACKTCNLKKATNLIEDWFRLGQQILAI